jgi:hypothetical protein
MASVSFVIDAKGGAAMAVEEVRLSLRRQLEDAFGVEEASILMDRPPGGWNDLVTNQTLDLKIDALRSDLRSEMAALRSELRGEMAELRGGMVELGGELRGEMVELRGEVRGEIAEMSASVDRRLRAQTWITTTTMLTAVGLVAALSRF